MQQLATITSKRQLTIPSALFVHLGFVEGQKVLVSEDNGALKVEPALDLVNKLAGSVRVPKKFKGMPIDVMVEKAKADYFIGKKV